MSQVATFWVIHPRHTEHAVMGDTHRNAASPRPWELGKLLLEGMELYGSAEGLVGHLRVTTPYQDTKLEYPHHQCARQLCSLCWQIHLAQGAELGCQEATWALPALLHWHLPRREPRPQHTHTQGCCVPQGTRGSSAAEPGLHLGLGTWERQGRGRGVIPAGKPGGAGCGRLEHGTHNLQGECAAPGCCWLLFLLLGADCCEKQFCWYHNVLSLCLGFCCCQTL